MTAQTAERTKESIEKKTENVQGTDPGQADMRVDESKPRTLVSASTKRFKQQPGRMVLVRTTPHSQRVYSEPEFLPAIITRVHPDGTVNLTIFNDSSVNTFQKMAVEGLDEGQWSWPERVKDIEEDGRSLADSKRAEKLEGLADSFGKGIPEDKRVEASAQTAEELSKAANRQKINNINQTLEDLKGE